MQSSGKGFQMLIHACGSRRGRVNQHEHTQMIIHVHGLDMMEIDQGLGPDLRPPTSPSHARTLTKQERDSDLDALDCQLAPAGGEQKQNEAHEPECSHA